MNNLQIIQKQLARGLQTYGQFRDNLEKIYGQLLNNLETKWRKFMDNYQTIQKQLGVDLQA